MTSESLLFTPRLLALWHHVEPDLRGAGLAHDAEHVLRVTRWVLRLAREEGVDGELSVAAGLVHDLVQVPKESSDRPLGGELSAVAGRQPLADSGFTGPEIEAIVEAVRTSSWSRGLEPTTPLGAILQDADRLDAIGALGIARNFACAQEMASRSGTGRLYDPEDPLGHSKRSLDDRLNAMDHWKKKLLKLAQGMHTRSARTESAHRHAFLLAFLDQMKLELESPIAGRPE
jgi:uncharacterized protein